MKDQLLIDHRRWRKAQDEEGGEAGPWWKEMLATCSEPVSKPEHTVCTLLCQMWRAVPVPIKVPISPITVTLYGDLHVSSVGVLPLSHLLLLPPLTDNHGHHPVLLSSSLNPPSNLPSGCSLVPSFRTNHQDLFITREASLWIRRDANFSSQAVGLGGTPSPHVWNVSQQINSPPLSTHIKIIPTTQSWRL